MILFSKKSEIPFDFVSYGFTMIFFFIRPSQAFYPCPPPGPEDDQPEFDPFDYLNTIVRL